MYTYFNITYTLHYTLVNYHKIVVCIITDKINDKYITPANIGINQIFK